MRALIQRVTHASVQVKGRKKSEIGKGILVLLGIESEDNQQELEWLVGKVAKLRIFDDEAGQMNLAIADVSKEAKILVVSQFTLHASTRKGNRPSYIRAARPEIAEPMYKQFVQALQSHTGLPVLTGVFGAHMQVALTNDGPVTILIDSRLRE